MEIVAVNGLFVALFSGSALQFVPVARRRAEAGGSLMPGGRGELPPSHAES